MHSGKLTRDMAPEHDVGLEIDPDADDHGYSRESDGFKVLMVVVEEECIARNNEYLLSLGLTST